MALHAIEHRSVDRAGQTHSRGAPRAGTDAIAGHGGREELAGASDLVGDERPEAVGGLAPGDVRLAGAEALQVLAREIDPSNTYS